MALSQVGYLAQHLHTIASFTWRHSVARQATKLLHRFQLEDLMLAEGCKAADAREGSAHVMLGGHSTFDARGCSPTDLRDKKASIGVDM